MSAQVQGPDITGDPRQNDLARRLERDDIICRRVFTKDYDPDKMRFVPGAKCRPASHLFFMMELDVPRNDGLPGLVRRFEPVYSDAQGELNHLQHRTTPDGRIELTRQNFMAGITQAMHHPSKGAGLTLVRLPVQDVQTMMLAYGREEWKAQMHKLLSAPDVKKDIPFIPLQKIPIKEIDLNAFPGQGKSLQDLGQISGFASALVLPRFRTVYVTFTSADLVGALVSLTSIDTGRRFSDRASDTNGFGACAAIGGAGQYFVSGLYYLHVELPKGVRLSQVLGKTATGLPPDARGWTLMVHLDFPIETPLGPAQVVRGDPVTVEEVLVQQFPDAWKRRWSARLKALNGGTFRPAEAPALDRLLLTGGAASKWAAGTLTATSARDIYWNIADALKTSVFIQSSPELRSFANLVFTSRDIRNALHEGNLKTLGDLAALKQKGRLREAAKTVSFWKEASKTLGLNWTDPLEQQGKPFYLSTLDVPRFLKGPLDVTLRSARAAGSALDVFSLSAAIMGIPQTWASVDRAASQQDHAVAAFRHLAGEYARPLSLPDTGRPMTDHSSSGQHSGWLPDDILPEEPFRKALKPRKRIAMHTLRFGYGHNLSTLRKNDMAFLASLADTLAEKLKSGSRLIISLTGHASTPGSDSWNQLLSEKRAREVEKALKRALRARGADPADYPESLRIEVTGRGESEPVTRPDGSEDEAASKRVVLDCHEVVEGVPAAWLPCREAQQSLALRCDAAIAASLGYDKAWATTLLTTLSVAYDSVTVILGVIPGLQPVSGALIAAKAIATALANGADLIGSTEADIIRSSESVGALGGVLEYGLALAGNALDSLEHIHKSLAEVRDRARHNEVLTLAAARDYARAEQAPDAERDARLESWTALQFHLRYQILNGLLGLIQRACWLAVTGDEPRQSSLAKWFDRLDIPGYIDTYLLRDGWLFDTREAIPVAPDALWLSQVRRRSWYTRTDGQHVIRHTPEHLYMASFTHGLRYHYQRLTSYHDLPWRDHVYARTQTLFPLHGQFSQDTEMLATQLATIVHTLTPESVAWTDMYWCPRGKAGEWSPFRFRFGPFGNHAPLSPFEPVRILVVMEKYEIWPSHAEGIPDKDYMTDPLTGKRFRLDKHKKPILLRPSPVPVTLWLHRFDGINVSCPLMDVNLHILQEHELPEEERHYAGRLGAVIHPFFQFGPVTHHGLRPVASDNWLDMAVDLMKWAFSPDRAECGWRYGALSHMTCALSLRFGNDKTDYFLAWTDREISRNPLEASHDSLFTMSVDPERVHEVDGRRLSDEYLLTDNAFLTQEAVTYAFPKLFDGQIRVELFFRFDNGPWLHPSPAWNAERTFSDPVTGVFAPESAPSDHLADHALAIAKLISLANMSNLEDLVRYHALTLNEAAWDTPTEMLVVVTCDRLGKAYTNEGGGQHPLPLHPVGVQLQACSLVAQFENDNATLSLDDVVNGPMLSTTVTSQGQLNPEQTDQTKLPPLLKSLIDSAPVGARQRRQALTTLLGQGTRHVFAGTLKLNYQGPSGRTFQGLRPFGELYGEHFKRKQPFAALGFGRIVSAGDSGLDVEGWTPQDSDHHYLLLIQLPETLKSSLWKKLPDGTDPDTLRRKQAENETESLTRDDPDSPARTILKHALTPALRWAKLPQNKQAERLQRWLTDAEEATWLKQKLPSVLGGS